MALLLKAFRFKYDPVLEACIKGTHHILVANVAGPFETGRHIRKIQQALLDLGYSLPLHGADGTYGQETASVVFQFKQDRNIRSPDGSIDGVVGVKTMTELDAAFADEVPFPIPAPAPGNLTLDDFFEAIQAAEGANPSDTLEQLLTRIRQLYYPGSDPNGLTFREIAFDHLLPNAPIRFANGTRRILTPVGMAPIFFARLSQHAPENPTPGIPLDNPSPYLVDVTGARIDIGHLLLTMDALLHPAAGEPYQTFGIPAIDVASWVADLGIAAVWAEQDGSPDAPRVLPRLATGAPDFAGYYVMSAPDADLLGDIDGFNIIRSMLAGQSLASSLLRYYRDGETAPGLYRQRFRMFTHELFATTEPNAQQLIDGVATWKTRVNRFNNLFSIGPVDAFLTLVPPPPREWVFAGDAVANFFQWLMDNARIESDRFD